MAEGSVKVRRARIGDIPSIVAIERESFVEPWDTDTFHMTLDWYPMLFYVAVVDEAIVGFLSGAFEDTPEGRYGHICNIAVTSGNRRKGIGQLLVRSVERQFRRETAVSIILEVRFSNTGAQRFYSDLGYQQVFVIQSYYSNGEDAIVMMKGLPVF
ncbi:MAG: ribosomal protein S18-alanine N-acetyltransferase [Methanomicrobiales archaeon]|nr:ribosomal protein S18-alanine N-acetyltransferase [Methanomicrobiales archaeon]